MLNPTLPSTPHVPTAAQLTQLNVLQAAETSAKTTLDAAISSLKSAQSAFRIAQSNTQAYQSYINGQAAGRPGALDEGNPNAV